MTDINISFCRELLKKAHELVKENFGDDINLKKDAWVWFDGHKGWEFRGPDKFYWYGNADNAYHARYQGWMAWLKHKGVDLDETEE